MNGSYRLVYRIGISVLAILGMFYGSPAMSQTDEWTPPWIVTVQNDYIGLSIGAAGKWKVPENESHNMIGEQPVGGRFQIWTTGGDPTTLLDDDMPLIYSDYAPPYPGDKWGAFQVMVDGVSDASGTEETSERVWCIFERGETSAVLGDLVDGAWAVWPYVPTNASNTIIGTWYPSIEKGISPTTGSEVDVVKFRLRCDLEARIMRDTVRFKWTFTNMDSISHNVGLRMYADVMANPIDDGTIDYRNIVSIPGRPLILNRTVIQGTEVPSELEMFNSQLDPVMSVRQILKGQGATVPDAVGVDEWPIVASGSWTYWYGASPMGGDPYATWAYEPVPYMAITDLGSGVFWKPRRVTPGSSLTYITYMGLGCATSDFTKPNMSHPQYVAAVQGPRTLQYISDDTGVGHLYPAPFEIHGYMTNLEKAVDLQDASLTITLPDGLDLDASEGGKYTKSVSRVNAGTEAHVSWKVVPVGSPTGILNYTLSASASPVGGTTVRRQINIPATEFQPLSSGWQMISVPFSLASPDPASALGLIAPVFWRYDPLTRTYKSVTKFVPGEAYWLKLSTAQNTMMTPGNYSPMLWAGTQGYQIPLQSGWNLVGNPYVYTVTIGEAKFYHRDYGAMTYEEALSHGLLTTTIFWWDPRFRQYRWSSDRSTQLKPWQGYWVRALRPGLTMILTPESQIGAAVGGSPIDDGSGGGDGPPPGP